jgi:hypothetical protein
MEDELERNMTTLVKINDINEVNDILYLYIPDNGKVDNGKVDNGKVDNGKIENYIITQNYKIVNNLAKEKNGRIVIFNKDALGLYKFYKK